MISLQYKLAIGGGEMSDREKLIDRYLDMKMRREILRREFLLSTARKLEYVWPSFKSSKALSRAGKRRKICHFYRSVHLLLLRDHAVFFRFLLSSRDPITPQAKHIACEFA